MCFSVQTGCGAVLPLAQRTSGEIRLGGLAGKDKDFAVQPEQAETK